MPMEQFCITFGLEDYEFTGFLSDTEITDISENNIATVITERDIIKMCDQLDHSMGSYMQYFQVLCILLSVGVYKGQENGRGYEKLPKRSWRYEQ